MFFSRRSGKSRRKGSAAFSGVEALEIRSLLTTYGLPWSDPRSLSISFPGDGTPIGSEANDIRQTLGAVTTRTRWQTAALQAFQTWAEVANINVGLVADRSDAFGTAGLASNDPRFGEVRIGAFSQPGVLASAVPFQPVAGTWSGDVLLNSDVSWYLGNSPGQQAPGGKGYELRTVLLHEAGNSLGLEDRQDAGYVMSSQYTSPRWSLTADDISAIRAIYGARQDIWESVPNESSATATPIVLTAAEAAVGRAVRSGSLNTADDRDFYSFVMPAGKTSATVTVWASGISLLESRLTVRGQQGGVLGSDAVSGVFQNNGRVHLTGLTPGAAYVISVDSLENSSFRVGDYRLDLDYRDPAQLTPTTSANYDSAAYSGRQRLQNADNVGLPQLFSTGLVDSEVGQNDRPATATALQSTPGFISQSRYEAMGAIATAVDRDLYTIVAPAGAVGSLNITLTALGTVRPDLTVVVMNQAGDRMPSQLKVGSDGLQSLVVPNAVPGQTYVVGVWQRAGAVQSTGNYLVTADFSTAAAQMTVLTEKSLAIGAVDADLLSSSKSQLFRFDLTTFSTSAGKATLISIIDVRTQQLVRTISAAGGVTASAFVWLPVGDYQVVAKAYAQGSTVTGPVSYRLLADVVSDDDGPGYGDPSAPPGPAPEPPPYTYNEDPNGDPLPPTLPGPDEDPFYQMPFWELVDDFFDDLIGSGT
ncbi:MAG: matrixin family metalloprotease [Planctomyces sp.]